MTCRAGRQQHSSSPCTTLPSPISMFKGTLKEIQSHVTKVNYYPYTDNLMITDWSGPGPHTSLVILLLMFSQHQLGKGLKEKSQQEIITSSWTQPNNIHLQGISTPFPCYPTRVIGLFFPLVFQGTFLPSTGRKEEVFFFILITVYKVYAACLVVLVRME